MRRMLFLVGVVVLLVATACGGHSPTRNAASHTPVPNTRIVPRHITVAYVDAVFVKLNHIYGDAVRAAVKAKAVTPAVRTDLHAIYTRAIYPKEVVIFAHSIAKIPPTLINPPGDQVTKVRELIHSSRSCIFVSVSTTYSKVLRAKPTPAASNYYELRTYQRRADDLDPTEWKLAFNESFLKKTSISDPCV